MSIHRKKGSKIYHIDITAKDGGRIRRSTKTTDRNTAQKFHDKIKHELWCINNINKKPQRTWSAAIASDAIEKPNSFRCLKKHEAKMILDELPEHLKDMMLFSLETGLRQSNVAELTWSKIDMNKKEAWIEPVQGKKSKTISVLLNDAAIEILLSLRGKHPVYVFTYNGNRIKQANISAWRKALDRAGISAYIPVKYDSKKIHAEYPTKNLHEYKHKKFSWHNLRHTWAIWHAQA